MAAAFDKDLQAVEHLVHRRRFFFDYADFFQDPFFASTAGFFEAFSQLRQSGAGFVCPFLHGPQHVLEMGAGRLFEPDELEHQ